MASQSRRRSRFTSIGKKSRTVRAAIEMLEQRKLMSTNVLTYHYDNSRDGVDSTETTLTPANVNTNQFGKLFSLPTDAQVYAQPLLQTNVSIPGQGVHNVLYVATENDTVYAFDAKGNNPAQGYLWKTSLLQSGETAVSQASAYPGTNDITPLIGITSTPVINPSTNTIYVVGLFAESNGSFEQRLYALDTTTGSSKFGGPVTIAGSVPGTASDGNGTTVSFDPKQENQRAALTLANGEVYIAWASHGDETPWHGWVFAYNAATLHQDDMYCTTPNGNAGGIWMSGGGLSVDSSGDLYLSTGNGTFDANTNGGDYAMAIEKLSPSLGVLDYFSPTNEASLSGNDLDYGCSSVIVLPTQLGNAPNEIVSAGKWGTVYLNNSNTGSMGEFNSSTNNNLSSTNIASNVDTSNLHNTMAYFNGEVYVGGDNVSLQAFSIYDGSMSSTPVSQSPDIFNSGNVDGDGTGPVISANGTGDGIVWAVDDSGYANGFASVLHAYDAANLGDELYNSAQAPGGRDAASGAVKYITPVVANGLVYVGGASAVTVYGLLGTQAAQRYTQVNLASSSFDQQGIVNDGTRFTNGGLDGSGNAISRQSLPSAPTWDGTAFAIGSATANNVVYAAGQTIALPAGSFRSLNFLATSANGNATSQTFRINYTNNTIQNFTISLSKWQQAQSYPDESVAFTTTYHDIANGTKVNNSPGWNIYGYSLPMESTAVVASVTLPVDTSIKILAIDEVGGETQVNLSSSYNAYGLTTDGSTYSAANSLDQQGNTLSANLLGNKVSWSGQPYALGAPNALDAIAANGQTISLPQGEYNSLSFIGLAVNGNQYNQSFSVMYTDGTTQTFTQSLSDWFGPQNFAGESIVANMPYRNVNDGTMDNRTFYAYSYSFQLNPNKTVESITLPVNSGVIVLAMDLTT